MRWLFLIIPEQLHVKAKDFFENARVENIGPSYNCPFIDAHWTWGKTEPHIPIETEQAYDWRHQLNEDHSAQTGQL
jgi:hypothetical protein